MFKNIYSTATIVNFLMPRITLNLTDIILYVLMWGTVEWSHWSLPHTLSAKSSIGCKRRLGRKEVLVFTQFLTRPGFAFVTNWLEMLSNVQQSWQVLSTNCLQRTRHALPMLKSCHQMKCLANMLAYGYTIWNSYQVTKLLSDELFPDLLWQNISLPNIPAIQ